MGPRLTAKNREKLVDEKSAHKTAFDRPFPGIRTPRAPSEGVGARRAQGDGPGAAGSGFAHPGGEPLRRLAVPARAATAEGVGAQPGCRRRLTGPRRTPSPPRGTGLRALGAPWGPANYPRRLVRDRAERARPPLPDRAGRPRRVVRPCWVPRASRRTLPPNVLGASAAWRYRHPPSIHRRTGRYKRITVWIRRN